jgi:hypothetical protein
VGTGAVGWRAGWLIGSPRRFYACRSSASRARVQAPTAIARSRTAMSNRPMKSLQRTGSGGLSGSNEPLASSSELVEGSFELGAVLSNRWLKHPSRSLQAPSWVLKRPSRSPAYRLGALVYRLGTSAYLLVAYFLRSRAAPTGPGRGRTTSGSRGLAFPPAGASDGSRQRAEADRPRVEAEGLPRMSPIRHWLLR